MGGELSRRKGGTQNLEAYQFYLRARSAFDQYDQPGSDGRCRRILTKRSNSTRALAGRGRCWRQRTSSKTTDGSWPTRGRLRPRAALAQHALQLSPDLAEAHASSSLGSDYDRELGLGGRGEEVQRALAIDPRIRCAVSTPSDAL